MHESITIAEVGDIVNVSGSRIATPLAPPRPGSTPISTPSVMPISMRSMFMGVRMTLKPWNKALISFMAFSVGKEGQRVQHALRQWNLEPHFEHHVEEHGDHQ